MAAAGGALSDIDVFPITVTAITGSESYRDTLKAKFTKTSRDLKQGDKMDVVDVPLTVVDITWNQS